MNEAAENAPEERVSGETQGPLSTEDKIQMLGLTTAPRVTPDQIEALMERVTCVGSVIPDTTTTILHAFLDEKFYLATAASSTVSAENFNEDIGIEVAQNKLIPIVREKLWELEGYRLWCSQQEATEPSSDPEA